SGRVASVTGNQIILTKDGKLPEGKKKIRHASEEGVYVYHVRKFMRSNAATCINQKILVGKGDEIGRASCREGVEKSMVAEDGIRDATVTGVQTCALPI